MCQTDRDLCCVVGVYKRLLSVSDLQSRTFFTRATDVDILMSMVSSGKSTKHQLRQKLYFNSSLQCIAMRSSVHKGWEAQEHISHCFHGISINKKILMAKHWKKSCKNYIILFTRREEVKLSQTNQVQILWASICVTFSNKNHLGKYIYRKLCTLSHENLLRPLSCKS